MKKRKYILKCIVSVIMIGMLVCGCGKEEATVTEESNTEMIEEPVSETSVEEEEAIPEEQVADDAETQESVESTEMVDWETFAAQEGNEENCVVVSNESLGYQDVLLIDEGQDHREYTVQEGDKFAIPLNDNIFRITYWTATSDVIEMYNNTDSAVATSKFIEFHVNEGEIYQINITDVHGNNWIFVLIN